MLSDGVESTAAVVLVILDEVVSIMLVVESPLVIVPPMFDSFEVDVLVSILDELMLLIVS